MPGGMPRYRADSFYVRTSWKVFWYWETSSSNQESAQLHHSFGSVIKTFLISDVRIFSHITPHSTLTSRITDSFFEKGLVYYVFFFWLPFLIFPYLRNRRCQEPRPKMGVVLFTSRLLVIEKARPERTGHNIGEQQRRLAQRFGLK